MDHCVRSSQSGILYYPLSPAVDASYATCVTQAAALSLDYPFDQLCVVPAGNSVLSNRPPLTFQELYALAVAGNPVRQTVLLQNGG